MATVSDIITRARQRLDDISDTAPSEWLTDDSGYSWTNDELVSYLDEAIEEHTRRVPLIDSSTAQDGGAVALCQITLVDGTATYTISDRILRIEEVVLDRKTATGDDGTLQKYDRHRAMDLFLKDSGDVYAYQLDDHMNTIRFIDTPAAVDDTTTVTLTVHRLPLNTPYDWATDKNEIPEIRVRDHFHLVHYIEYLARLKRDHDTEQQGLSALALQRFDNAIGPQRSAHLEMIGKEIAGGPYRTTTYYY